MFSYILVVFRGCILLVSIYRMLKVGKLYTYYRKAILAILLKNYFKGGFLLNCTKNSTDCFMLEVLTVDTVSRFQNKILLEDR